MEGGRKGGREGDEGGFKRHMKRERDGQLRERGGLQRQTDR